MKSVARLSGTLLARKGFAAPSQESVTYALTHHMPQDVQQDIPQVAPQAAKAIPEPEIPRPAAFKPAPHPEPEQSGKRVAMTLRLDNDRHLKLRVFSAHSNLSSQEILTAALDDYLTRQTAGPALSHCECLQQGIAPGKACR